VYHSIGAPRLGQPQGWQHRIMPKGFVAADAVIRWSTAGAVVGVAVAAAASYEHAFALVRMGRRTGRPGLSR
jgi:hypothetical protein